MILSKDELIGLLGQEVRILLHLAGKVDRAQLDYRPTPTQRTTLELLRYMAIMGPTQLGVITADAFNRAGLTAAWRSAEATSKAMTFDQAVAAIAAQADEYARVLGAWADADFRIEVDLFGTKATRASLIVSQMLNGYAAYRTQLFCYLKSCGRDELGTLNLWAGVDAMKTA